MSKLMMLATILALVLVLSIPAMAQSSSVSNSGDYAMICAASQQTNNEGSVEENSATFDQQYSESDDFESGGTTLTFAPGQENACDQSVQQASNASS